ncbi:hypothetical protein RDABS01_000593 [Bienertia sinuspersici]
MPWSDGNWVDKYRRAKTNLNVLKPLRRHQNTKNKACKVVTIDLKYVWLPSFFFLCGVMGHSEKDCTYMTEDDTKIAMGWRAWLKASPCKDNSHNLEEEAAMRASRKKLFIVKYDKEISLSQDRG